MNIRVREWQWSGDCIVGTTLGLGSHSEFVLSNRPGVAGSIL